jgi:hypothetical protein
MARVTPDNDHPDFPPILEELFELYLRPLAPLGVNGPVALPLHAIRGTWAAMYGFVLLEISG